MFFSCQFFIGPGLVLGLKDILKHPLEAGSLLLIAYYIVPGQHQSNQQATLN